MLINNFIQVFSEAGREEPEPKPLNKQTESDNRKKKTKGKNYKTTRCHLFQILNAMQQGSCIKIKCLIFF